MKKAISIAAIAAGVLILSGAAVPVIVGFLFEIPPSGSLGIIGGADGPTAVLIAETVGMGIIGWIIAAAAGILLAAAGIWGLKKNKVQGKNARRS